MGTLLRAFGMGLAAFGVLLVLIGLSDDAPGAILIAMIVFATSGYALLGARREEARADRIEELLRRIAETERRG